MTDPSPSLATPYRTHTCGQLRAADAGSDARLSGWVHRRRDYGSLIFIDLRDRHGITQVVVDGEDAPPEVLEAASRVRPEFVISVLGEVAARLAGTENAKLPTGDIELRATELTILSEAKTPPFYINEPDAPVDESVRLKYRYLDIRREPMQRNLLLRSRMVQAIREVHHAHGFLEIETPTLIKSTPEGARDFIVPSRLQPGSVYALPQSPQQLKQLLMVGGIDRYFQIARCYRDEDLRGDRQPEFTQLDLEMSFVDEASVMGFVEAMAIEVSWATVPDRPILQTPFPIVTFEETLERFGSDKPDVRFGMELVDLAPALVGADGAPASGFGVFDSALAVGGRVKAIVAPGMAGVTRREIDELTGRARRFGAKGLAHLALAAGGEIKGPITKFLSDDTQRALIERSGAAEGDLILIVADDADTTAEVLGRLRVELGARLGLADPNVLAYVWVHRFPMYQWDTDNKRWDATHNPFSDVLPEDEALLVTTSGDPARPAPDDPAGRARALQYDLALNGWELGGGSIRIHRRELLERSFLLQGQTIEAMREKFGAVLEAFEYGAPPHGGIALGIDRWAALLADQTNIREVMAFPKTQSGSDLMLEAPSAPEPSQYEELGLRFVGVPEKRS
ncbi:MAG: aspartate--tRNA ligase [Candidatus Limnocylindrales bacterium]|nr:aspartate--tRNA ligase [Candidatus Limnocylindrales bacterium]